MTVELENEEGGFGLNIPGKVTDEGYGCKVIVWVNAFMGDNWLCIHGLGRAGTKR